MADFLVNVRTQFETVGFQQVAAQVRRMLAELSSVPAPQRARAAQEIRAGAETRIADLTRQRAAGLDPNAPDYSRQMARIRGMQQRALRDVELMFRQVSEGMPASVPGLRGYETDIRRNVTSLFRETDEAFARMTASTRASIQAAARQAPRPSDARVQAELGVPAFDRTAVGEASDRAAEAAYRQRVELMSRAMQAGVGVGGTEDEIAARTAVQERINALRRQTAVSRAQASREGAAGQELAAAEADLRRATRELAEQRHREQRAEVVGQIQRGEGTWFQRTQARFAYRGQNRDVEDYQRLGQFVGSRALTTVGFGIAGSALYGGVRVIGDMIRESSELDRILNQVEAQMESLGDTGTVSMGNVREEILGIAAATGQQADQVAGVFFQFRGAFGEGETGANAVTAAMEQTDAAMRTVAVTGLTLQEVLDSLVAASNTYSVSIEELTDRAIGLQERTGAAARETLAFTADLAPVADQVGLSMEQVTAIGAVAIQQSGRAGSALAEGWARVLPEIQAVGGEILNLYSLPALAGGRDEMLEGLASGDMGVVIDRLIRDYAQLSESQQAYVTNLLGGRRETQALAPVLENASQYLRQMGEVDDAGKLDEYFANLQNTVQMAQARFTEMFKQIGEAIFRSGVADAMVDILTVGGQLMSMFADLAGFVGGFNDALDGVPLRLAAFALLARLVGVHSRTATTFITGKVLATRADTAASQQQSQAYIQVTQTARGMELQVRNAARTDTVEAGTSARNAAANRMQAGAYQMTSMGGMGALAASIPGGRSGAFTQRLGNMAGRFGLGAAQLGLGGGSVIARGMPRAGGMLGSLAAGAPMFLAFEGLSQFFSNVAEEADEVNALASDTTDRLRSAREGTSETGESYAEAMAAVRERAERERARSEGYLPGDDILSRGVNFIGGLFTGNDNAMRAAAGQEQDWEVLERQIAASEAEEHNEVIGSVLQYNAERLAEALRNSTAATVGNDILSANRGVSGASELASIFLSEGERGLRPGQIGTIDWENVMDPEEMTVENIRAVVDLALEGNLHAENFLARIREYAENDPALRALLEESGLAEEVDAAEGQLMLRVEEARAAFEGGIIGSGAYLDILRDHREDLIELLNAQRAEGNTVGAADTAAQLGEINEAITGVLDDATTQRLESLQVIYETLGGGAEGGDSAAARAVMEQRIATLRAAVLNPETDIAARFEAIPDLLSLLREQWEAELAGITDPVERARREAEGFQIPPEIRAVWAAGMAAQDPTHNAALTQLSEITGTSLQGLVNNLAQTVLTTGQTATEIVLGWIDSEISRLMAIIPGWGLSGYGAFTNPEEVAQVRELQALRDSLQGATLPGLPATGGTGGGGGSGSTPEELARAREALERARAQGDPVAEAQAAINAARNAMREAGNDQAARMQAQAQLIEAERQMDEALFGITEARYDLMERQAARDPIRQAQVAIDRANAAAERARGEAARIQAQGDLLDAQAQMREALLDLAIAQSEQVETFADLAGDTVGAAAARVQQALATLNDVLSDPGTGEAERIRAANDYWRALGAQRDAQFEDQMGDIDFMLEMEQIGVQQAIRMLEAMMRIPGLTEEQIRNLQRRIRGLREEARADYQFNIPSEIDLPTLYEVRRLNQTPSGQGYNDNRQIIVNFTANNTADAEQIANTIVDRFAGPSRYGNAPRGY